MAQGSIRPKEVKVCVIGSPNAGKTTLVLAISGRSQSSDDDGRTAGIDIIPVDIEEAGGRLIFFDTAGHEVFHRTHSLFFRGACTLFIYVVDASALSLEQILDDASYFLAFVKSGRPPDDPPPYVLFISSRGEKSKELKKMMLETVMESLKEKFAGCFIFHTEPFVIDCRNAKSEDMGLVKQAIAVAKEKCLEVQDFV